MKKELAEENNLREKCPNALDGAKSINYLIEK